MAPPDTDELARLEQRRGDLRTAYVRPPGERAATNGRGIHHAALICSDVEQTIQFYQGLLGFPLVELVENRDYPGSSHFFFDLGNDTLLGFFDFPGLGLDKSPEGFGGVQHIAIAVPPEAHAALRARLDERGIPYDGPQRGIPESLYLRDPDGIGIELLSDEPMWFGGQWLDGR
jgi:glyoxylase I family protein